MPPCNGIIPTITTAAPLAVLQPLHHHPISAPNSSYLAALADDSPAVWLRRLRRSGVTQRPKGRTVILVPARRLLQIVMIT